MVYKKAGLSLWIVEWLSLAGTLRCRLVLHPACLWAGSPTASKAPPCSVHQILEMKFPSGTNGTSHPWNIKPTPTKGLLTFQCLMVPHESAMHSTFRLMSPSAYSDFFFFFGDLCQILVWPGKLWIVCTQGRKVKERFKIKIWFSVTL